jgi:hypothetical protein
VDGVFRVGERSDVLNGVSVEDECVGTVALSDSAELVLLAEKLRGSHGRRLKDLQRGQYFRAHGELPGLELVHRADEVRAECHLHPVVGGDTEHLGSRVPDSFGFAAGIFGHTELCAFFGCEQRADREGGDQERTVVDEHVRSLVIEQGRVPGLV